MADENSLSKYTKLNDTNWRPWNFQLRVYANSKDALDVLTTEMPENADGPLKKKYKDIYTFICLTCTDIQQSYLHDVPLGDSFRAYQSLANIYESKTSHSIFQLLSAVVTAKQNGSPAITFTSQVSNDTSRLRNAVKELNLDIYDVIEGASLLSGVDSAFETTVEAIKVSGESKVSKIRSIILERAERLKTEGMSAEHTSAMVTAADSKPTKPCPTCLKEKGKQFFHWRKDCYIEHPEKKPVSRQQRNARYSNGKHTFAGNKAETDYDDNQENGITSAWPAVADVSRNNIATAVYTATSSKQPNTLTLKIDSGAKGVDVFLSPDNIAGIHNVQRTNCYVLVIL